MTRPHSLTRETLEAYRRSDVFRSMFPEYDDMFTRVIRYGAPIGSIIEKHDVMPRCMDRLRLLINEAGRDGTPLPSGAVIMARELANGSGRFGREWFAPEGGLWLALAWADTLLPDYSRLLPLAAGTACCQAVRSYGVGAAIKWVNDIHVDGRKLGGILCETCIDRGSGDRYHLVGIGMNCNNTEFPESLRENAVSMRGLLGAQLDLDDFALRLLAMLTFHFGLVHLQEEQELAHGREDMPATSPVVDAWNRYSDTPGRKVLYGFDVVREPLYRGMVTGIDRNGGIVLRLADGRMITEASGEIVYLPNGSEF